MHCPSCSQGKCIEAIDVTLEIVSIRHREGLAPIAEIAVTSQTPIRHKRFHASHVRGDIGNTATVQACKIHGVPFGTAQKIDWR
jgi:hypothetical protein